MSIRKPMVLVLAGPNGSGKSTTIEPVRIIRKHKDDITIFANELWSEENILGLMQ